MKCSICGKELGDRIKFCPYCSAAVISAPDGPEPASMPVGVQETDAYEPAEYVALFQFEEVGKDAVKHEDIEKVEGEEKQSGKKKRKGGVVFLIVIVLVCIGASLFYIGPKFLGIQLLPIDPFGVGGENKNGEDIADVGDIAEIESVSLSIADIITISSLEDDPEIPVITIDVGEELYLRAAVKPSNAERGVKTEWDLSDNEYGSIDSQSALRAVFVAAAPGRVAITFTAYTDLEGRKDSRTLTAPLNIARPGSDDTLPPFQGDVYVTSEKELGIFIRSDPGIQGDGNVLDDGNKIGWIDGGDVSVELIATGNEYLEDVGRYWWYEVEIPQWYRDTSMQMEYYAGKSLTGWVREDVVKRIR